MKKFLISYAVLTLALSAFAEPLRVASFNLRMDTSKDGKNAWGHRKDLAKDLIERHAFDVCSTQEGFKHQLDYLTRGGIYARVGVARDDGEERGEYAAIIYDKRRVKLMDSGDFWFSETPKIPSKGWDAACNRVCSWAKFEDLKTGKSFFFFSLHLDHKGKAARANSVGLLLEKVSKIAKDAPVMAAGDFNAGPSSSVVSAILEGGLFDSFKISAEKPSGPKYTYHGFKGLSAADPGAEAPDKRIDYIFVSKGVKILKCAVISDNDGGRYPSDHFPVVADAELE